VSQRRNGATQSPSVAQPEPRHIPIPLVIPEHVWPVGQPLRGARPQPGVQNPPPPHTSPESSGPQARSPPAPAQPQIPRSVRHCGRVGEQSVVLPAVHSLHAPASGPDGMQNGRSGSGQLGAPSPVQPTHVRLAGEQTGVTPPQCALTRQATQTPTPDAVSQRGVAAGQWDTSSAVHAAQAPVGRQIGVAPPHSACEAHARQTLLPESHTGVVPLQCPLPRHATHIPAATLQTGVVPLQRVALLAEHCPHAPPGWHAGSAPPHSVSAAQPRQVKLALSQTPAGEAQSALPRQPTQRPAPVSHSGVAPVHAAALAAEHWPHAPLG
jgi:hypothetical protein